jgi:UDP-N-acetylmuramoyl-tripeptide--D-alanyl-D-alanine ligase
MIQHLHQVFLNSSGINTDTRKIEKGQLFFALIGNNFNGNNYVEEALKQGATHAVCSDHKFKDDSRVTVVKDVLTTLQQLATYHRHYIKVPLIGITGSNGKTTTKELIFSVLSTQFKVTATKGNLNNHIGVPLTLLSLKKNDQIGIIEMGANHPKEIAALCEIAQPDFGLITNYGKAHLEGFGGIEGVKTSKSELYDYLRKSSGTAIIGRWDPEQIVRSVGVKTILTPENTSIYSENPYISCIINGDLIKTNLTGNYNFHNALYAYSLGSIMGVTKENISKGLSSYTPTNNRSQVLEINNTKIILDAYNANPSSMKVALENLAIQNSKHKIAILGDMFELGIYAHEEHEKIALLAKKLKIDEVFLIGQNFFNTTIPATNKFKTRELFNNSQHIDTQKEQVILIKGSRGMQLENILKEKCLVQ